LMFHNSDSIILRVTANGKAVKVIKKIHGDWSFNSLSLFETEVGRQKKLIFQSLNKEVQK
jgi:hypothetical protein